MAPALSSRRSTRAPAKVFAHCGAGRRAKNLLRFMEGTREAIPDGFSNPKRTTVETGSRCWDWPAPRYDIKILIACGADMNTWALFVLFLGGLAGAIVVWATVRPVSSRNLRTAEPDES